MIKDLDDEIQVLGTSPISNLCCSIKLKTTNVYIKCTYVEVRH